MYTPALTVCLDDLKLEVKKALQTARALGFNGIDVGAVTGPISYRELSQSGRRHLVKHLSDLGLRLGSLRGPTGPGGYGDPASCDRRLASMREVISLASSLQVPVVSTTLGQIGNDANNPSTHLHEALSAIADDADHQGVIVTLETAGLPTQTLRQILSDIGCPQLQACCDTGAMLMQGEDPHSIANTLAGSLGLVRARDAVAGSPGSTGYETAIGEGQLDPARLLATLVEAGFSGDIVMSRQGGTNPAGDIEKARTAFAPYLF